MIIRFPIELTRPPADRRRLTYAEIDRCAAERGLVQDIRLQRYIKVLEESLIRQGVLHVD